MKHKKWSREDILIEIGAWICVILIATFVIKNW